MGTLARSNATHAFLPAAIIDSLWSTGLLWAQASAMQLLERARGQGHFAREPINSSATHLELSLHGMTSGVAMASLHSWLQELR